MRGYLKGVIRRLDGQTTGARGQSLIELAFTAPILVLMILGLVEIGFLANNYLTLMDVVRETARRAVVEDVHAWPLKGARDFHRLDCDQDAGYYNMIPGQSPGTNGYRDLGNPRGPQGLGYGPASNDKKPLSFFDGLTCHAIAIMEPLKFDDANDAKDDVVISVISYAMIDYNTIPAEKLAPGWAAQIQANPKQGYRVTVTGRYPMENRFCIGADGSGDVRDPFDFLRPEYLVNAHAGPGVADPGEPYSAENADYNLTGTSQGVRGYVFTGKAEANEGCLGSRFTVQEIENMLNLPLDTSLSAAKVPNGGLIIVEMHWQHHPLFLGPLFQGFTSGNKRNDPVLYIWAIFPVSSAEPVDQIQIP